MFVLPLTQSDASSAARTAFRHAAQARQRRLKDQPESPRRAGTPGLVCTVIVLCVAVAAGLGWAVLPAPVEAAGAVAQADA